MFPRALLSLLSLLWAVARTPFASMQQTRHNMWNATHQCSCAARAVLCRCSTSKVRYRHELLTSDQ